MDLDISRIHALTNKLVTNKLEQHYIILILIVILRYECIVQGGNNWNIPFNWYQYAYNKYNIVLEGFSSPLNSQLILLNNDAQFCSLFKDTDEVFGSVGSLFDLDIKNFLQKNYDDDNIKSITIHPPYIPYLLEQMTDLIERWLKTVPNIRIFAGMPGWSDYEPITRLLDNPDLKYSKLLKYNDFYVEDSMKKTVPKIFPSYTWTKWVFVLANSEKQPDEPEYETPIMSYPLV